MNSTRYSRQEIQMQRDDERGFRTIALATLLLLMLGVQPLVRPVKAASDGWAVGEGGTIVRWDGSSWSTVTPSPTDYGLVSVDMVSASDGWAVGWAGMIHRWDGSSWSTVTSPTGYDLWSVDMVFGMVEEDVIEDLAARVTTLESENAALKTRVSSLETRMEVVEHHTLALAVRGSNDHIYWCKYDGNSWGDWSRLPGTTKVDPAICLLENDLHIVVIGKQGRVYHGWIDLETDVFSGWNPITGAKPKALALISLP